MNKLNTKVMPDHLCSNCQVSAPPSLYTFIRNQGGLRGAELSNNLRDHNI